MTRTAASQSIPVTPIFFGSGGGAPVGRRGRGCTSGTTTTRSADPAALGGLFIEGPLMRRSDAHESLHVRPMPSDGRMSQRSLTAPASLAPTARSKRRSKCLHQCLQVDVNSTGTSRVRTTSRETLVCFFAQTQESGAPEGPSERLPNRTSDREPSRLDGDSVPVRAACLGLPRRGTSVKPTV